MDPIRTSVWGIVPSDLVVVQGLRSALDHLRSQPHLIDYCLAWMLQDDLTLRQHGLAAFQRAKAWLLETPVGVGLNVRLNQTPFPFVSVALLGGTEDAVTLSDQHYETAERIDLGPIVVAGPLHAPYDPQTGVVLIPDLPALAPLPSRLELVGRDGTRTLVLGAANGGVLVQPGLRLDLRGATLEVARPAYRVGLESVSYRENFQIGCYAAGEPEQAIWLGQAVLFCLLAHKEVLLEGRGLERSVVQVGGLEELGQVGEPAQRIFFRSMTLTGSVRQSWPKQIGPLSAWIGASPRVSGAGRVLPVQPDGPWVGDEDEQQDILVAMGIGAPPRAAAPPRVDPSPYVPPVPPPLGTYTQEVQASQPYTWWRMRDPQGSVVLVDQQGNFAWGVNSTNDIQFQQPGLTTEPGALSLRVNDLFSPWLNTAIGFSLPRVGRQFAFEFWFQSFSPLDPNRNTLNVGSAQWRGQADGSITIGPLLGGDLIAPAGTLVVNEAAHWVFTYDDQDDTLRLYKNGVEVASRVTVGYDNVVQLVQWNPVQNWNGVISEFALYGRNLTSAEILRHYQAGTQ